MDMMDTEVKRQVKKALRYGFAKALYFCLFGLAFGIITIGLFIGVYRARYIRHENYGRGWMIITGILLFFGIPATIAAVKTLTSMLLYRYSKGIREKMIRYNLSFDDICNDMLSYEMFKTIMFGKQFIIVMCFSAELIKKSEIVLITCNKELKNDSASPFIREKYNYIFRIYDKSEKICIFMEGVEKDALIIIELLKKAAPCALYSFNNDKYHKFWKDNPKIIIDMVEKRQKEFYY